MSTIKERIKKNLFYDAYKVFIKDDKNNFNRYNNVLDNTVVYKKIGNESKYGEVYRGKISSGNNNTLISIKKIPLQMEDMEIFLQNQHYDRALIFNKKTIWREIFLLRVCTKLVKLKKSIHLPLHYFFVYSSLNNWNRVVSKNGPYIYCFNELALGDLKSWSIQNRSYHEWISCFLQIFFGLYCLQYYCGFLHNDLHWGNILFYEVPKGGCWVYKIHDKEFFIQNEGFLFVLWDFGMSSLVPSLKGVKEHSKSCQDFLKILNTPKWIKKNYEQVVVPKSISDFCIHTRSYEYTSMDHLLEKVIAKFVKNTGSQPIETYMIC